MTDKHYKEGIKHINEINQEYIAKRNRMTKKIVDGVDVSGCDFYFGGVCSINGYDGCIDNSNCYYKKLARKTAKCENYKQALAEIEKIVSGTYYETEQTIRFKMQDIQDVIDKAKDGE